jgi:Na+/H+ antiporter NhaD/arsenite permease-like protein
MSQLIDQKRLGGNSAVITAIAIVAIAYMASLVLGWPQRGTRAVVEARLGEIAHEQGAVEHASIVAPPLWTVAPFALLLAAIAVLPLVHRTAHWWESNLNRLIVAVSLAALTLFYFLLIHDSPVEGHWPAHHVIDAKESLMQFDFVRVVFENAILGEYIPFIILLFSLYTISGGIRVTGDLQANPITNSLFLATGGLLASFIGTTGAAMLLIRPLLETNRQRKHVVHTVVIFIFVVCNCGGCLLPIGDPPLFLGYLQGVDFFWTLNLWKEWLFVNGLLIAVYFATDEIIYFRRESAADVSRDISQIRALKFRGVGLNGVLLLGVVVAVALLDPSKPIPGTHWHAWMYSREIVQLVLVAISLQFGSGEIRLLNGFNYGAILEVAALFLGIFICMQPALQILAERGDSLGIRTPSQFFWATGSLSSVLDNAPTYLVFFQTAHAMSDGTGPGYMAGVNELVLVGISLGAVFMGAMTYIGNGPNFMVKAVAEGAGVRMPSFFGYMLYSCGILLPILVLTDWIFLR